MTVQPSTASPPGLARDRLLVWAGLLGLALLAWGYLIYLSRDVAQTGGEMLMPEMHVWGAPDLALRFAQWAVMMVAMMLPSASPMVLGLVALLRGRPHAAPISVLAGLFVGGYLAAWTAFGALATLAQWGLQSVVLRSPATALAGPFLGGVLLVAAGIFQWTPFKHACLTGCRSPFGFFLSSWREGAWGAASMGLHHGLMCAGCCWLLMGLMLLTGAMNLLWMAALTALILIEKVAPGGEWVGRVGGALMAVGGLWLAGAVVF